MGNRERSQPDMIVVHQGQLTVWDELVEQSMSTPPGVKRLVAGMLSHLALCDDSTLTRIGRAARKQAEACDRRKRFDAAMTWSALLGACTDEWLRRHPRPVESSP